MSTKYGILHGMSIEKVSSEEADARARSVKCVKCIICGKAHKASGYIAVYNCIGYSANNKAVYFGLECYKPRQWNDTSDRRDCFGETFETIQNKVGHENTTAHRMPFVSIEVEAFSSLFGRGDTACMRAIGLVDDVAPDPVLCALYIRLLLIGSSKSGHGQTSELDCTVTFETAVFNLSLEGFSRLINECTPEELKALNNAHCGAHIHASLLGAPEYHAKEFMFYQFLSRIEAMTSDERISFFGSDFRNYATDDVGGHGCTVNVYTNYQTIELRLPRITCNEQIIKLMKMWRGVADIVCRQYYSRTISNKIAKQIDVALYGRKYNKGE